MAKKLIFLDRCEQGTPRGVMLFRRGVKYPVEALAPEAGGGYRVRHEPRLERQRHPETKERIEVPVDVTDVGADILEKLLKHGPAQLIEE